MRKTLAIGVAWLVCGTLASAGIAWNGGGKASRAGHKSGSSAPAPATASKPEPTRAAPEPSSAPAADIAAPGAVTATTPDGLRLGKAVQFHNISVVPVISSELGPFQHYTLLEAGLKAKTFHVRERKGNASEAQVNEVEVRNSGNEPVYLLGGEMILGGKQDRIIARDTVVPPDGQWVEVSVFCVERSRWSGGSMKFQAGGAIADASIQRAAMTGDQSAVWKTVAKKHELHGTSSETETYRRTVQNATLRRRIRPYVRDLAAQLPGDGHLVGIVFGINGRIRVADIFGNPVLFGDLQDKLLSAYVLEALGEQEQKDASPVSANDAGEFLGRARKGKANPVKGSARSRNYERKSGNIVGAESYDEKTGAKMRETYVEVGDE